MTLTDLCCERFGTEAQIAWRPGDGPHAWDGTVTLTEPGQGRRPGEVTPFEVELRPGHDAMLPTGPLAFGTPAAQTWVALEAAAAHCDARPPRASFVCGWADHRVVGIGRGELAAGTERDAKGIERLGEIYVARSTTAWGGSPELRVLLDGVGLLHEPAPDALWLLGELGHEIERRRGTVRLPAAGLILYGENQAGHEGFAAATLSRPAPEGR